MTLGQKRVLLKQAHFKQENLQDVIGGMYAVVNEGGTGRAGYLPNVAVAILIFVVAWALAAAVSGLLSRSLGDTATGRIAGAAAPVLIMGIATFMILDELNIAPAIVEITYIALLGSVALGMAIAFGLGGRDVASRLL